MENGSNDAYRTHKGAFFLTFIEMDYSQSTNYTTILGNTEEGIAELISKVRETSNEMDLQINTS